MADLLEDPDGAPYPEEVQNLVNVLEVEVLGEVDLAAAKRLLVEALESVAANAWERGSTDAHEWRDSDKHGDNGPPDPPVNPHERDVGPKVPSPVPLARMDGPGRSIACPACRWHAHGGADADRRYEEHYKESHQ